LSHSRWHRGAIDEQAPLSSTGDILVVSYDGVMAPMREATNIAWREASVATVSIYGQGKEGSEKRDTRFLDRMPERGMRTLLEQIADQVVRAQRGRSMGTHVEHPHEGRVTLPGYKLTPLVTGGNTF